MDEKDFRAYLSCLAAVTKMENLVERDIDLARRIEHMRNNLMGRGRKKYLNTVA